MSLETLSKAVAEFMRERDWERYHSPKNCAMALAVEAAELMEPLQYVGHEESRAHALKPEVKAHLEKEIADILLCLVQVARWCEVDIEKAAWGKLEELRERYVPEKIGGANYRKLKADDPALAVKLQRRGQR
jgi:NTP pyrophosphatase (non-canonical NTP hydrolase)